MSNEEFKCKGKIPKGSIKQIFCKFKGQFNLEGEGQGHKILNNTQLKFEGKVVAITRNYTKF